MSRDTDADQLLIAEIRAGNDRAWGELIDRYEGRLLAFVEARIGNRAAAEDVVQESLVGFLTSLPNYDGDRPLESYLFSIAAHKLTDHLRREGRRPAIQLSSNESDEGEARVPGRDRPVSSLIRSSERRQLEEQAVIAALATILDGWRKRGDWQRIMCAELLFVAGWGNKQVAERLQLSEQQVANQKFELTERLRNAMRSQRLNEDVFPELNS
ncbi:MAG: sigma-70 family RNA polymerase sigma factor [Planctomycetaceae bacterium]|nr:sigma-70 family RNA polymerase sigma factor [Planctomycetaceae bacterium]